MNRSSKCTKPNRTAPWESSSAASSARSHSTIRTFFPSTPKLKSSAYRSASIPAKAAGTLLDFFDLELNGTFATSHLPPIIGFRDLVAGEIPEKFPALKFGFLEVSASWVPFLYHHLKRSGRPRPSFPNARWKHASCKDLFRDYRIYVACEADEDIPYLAEYIGADNLLIGSDYGHNDPAEEKALVQTMQTREDLSAVMVKRSCARILGAFTD
jgi:hypothetical protein